MGAVASTRQHGPAPGRPPGSLYFLRISRDRWDDMEIDHLGKPTATVVGSWTLMAWVRFGPQLIDDIRAVARFVLVGVYGWLALSLLIYLAARFVAGRLSAQQESGPVGAPPGLEATVAKVGLAHHALAVGGFAIQILQILPIALLTSLVAVASVIWMGGQVVAAVASLQQRRWIDSTPAALTAWLAWLAIVGTYLWDRLGHIV